MGDKPNRNIDAIVVPAIFDGSFHLETNSNNNSIPESPILPTAQTISSEVPVALKTDLDNKEIKVHQCTHLNVNNPSSFEIPKAKL